ncbi:hypothetical protein H5410_033269 [Solanum commersonii]|uniref:RING-type domain-containing protein n=1 Tax=Solanum commersonii TaxID=4109 RepID=A0A9J5YMB0_SOLCO|nr:hypothetical protein H5410_033269 [Solanum commersonii]
MATLRRKGIDYSCSFVETNGRIDCSCVFCSICNEPKPVNNDTIKQGPCRHIYYEECIVNYESMDGYDDKRGFSIRTCPKCLDKFLW